jgi:GNAT superfamily N-acetyltransferase
MSTRTISVRRLHTVTDEEIAGLADVLMDCVEGGASISFMRPLSRAKALAFWQDVAGRAAREANVLLVAEDEAGIVGTVQLALDLPENQPHRAELAKMIVHRRGRRRGIGVSLLRAAEETALELGRTVLVLDTASADAERLYERQGWIRVGKVPDYALLPNGDRCATVFFYRQLDG